MTEEERFRAGKAQMIDFYNEQYLFWRVACIRSIKYILENMDEFYNNFEFDYYEKELPNERKSKIHIEIKNGWLFESIAQGIQAIEDLFSLLKNSKDIGYFAKNVINYKASEIKNYIWDFKYDDEENLLCEFQLPYCTADIKEWGTKEVYDVYHSSVLLIKGYTKDLVDFHKKYYDCYIQYKHGMAISLNHGRIEEKDSFGALKYFDNLNVSKRMQKSRNFGAMAFMMNKDTQPFLSELHREDNLLRFDFRDVEINNVLKIVTEAYILLSSHWQNLLSISNMQNDKNYEKYIFPTNDIHKLCEIGFSKQK